MPNKAVFLDRDGVINSNEGYYYVHKVEDFFINEGVAEFIASCKELGYKIIVITNQGGISKGFYTEDDVNNVHEYMRSELRRFGTDVDEIYFCPHHSDEEKCICRKPDSQMLEKGMARFDVDPKRSFFIGDNNTDFIAGQKAGLRAIKINANEDLRTLLKIIGKN